MGGSISKSVKKWKAKRTKPNDKIGKPFICPVCSKVFDKNCTYNAVNTHVDSCLESSPEKLPNIEALTERQPSTDLQQKYFNLLNNFETIRVPYTQGCSILSIARQNLYQDTVKQIGCINLNKVDSLERNSKLSL